MGWINAIKEAAKKAVKYGIGAAAAVNERRKSRI